MNSALTPQRFHVLIPCYNCEAYIGECLASLQQQTFHNWTALVADDASEDGTQQAVAPFLKDSRISYRRLHERAWLMGNTLDALRGLDLRPSDVVAILDGDDWIMRECLEKIWEKHCQGFDLVYTDEIIQGLDYSIGARLIPNAPVRKQTWRFSQLRSFKAYLFSLLKDADFRAASGDYFRAAGDLSLYLPMAELAGPEKVHFIPEKLYYYRVHDHCNFRIMRDEQLRNNWDIRTRPVLERQTRFFDFNVTVSDLEKADIGPFAARIRERFPKPCTIRVQHVLKPEELDAWRAYHGLWVEDGVFLEAAMLEDQ